VNYWKDLQSFFQRAEETDAALLTLCWGAMAAVYHFHKVLFSNLFTNSFDTFHPNQASEPQVPKYLTPRKQFGVFPHNNLAPKCIMMQVS
jgi:homoserine O-succinyltransferase